MLEVRQTDLFARWLRKLRDERARGRIQIRIRRLSLGNFGDARPVGGSVSELRIDYGPGYRIYFKRVEGLLVLLRIGGTKKTQDADIARAKKLAQEAQNGA